MPKMSKAYEEMVAGTYKVEKKPSGYQKIPKELQKKRGRKKKERTPIITPEGLICTTESEYDRKNNQKLAGVERSEIFKYYLDNGSNYSKTAEYYGVNPSSIRNILLTYEKKNTEEYDMIKRHFIEEQNGIVQTRSANLLNEITNKIEKEISREDRNYNVTQLGMLYGIIFDKARLMNGESTQNNAIQIKLSKDLEDLSK
jgi:transposase-like protein